jgi:opacity protein-like surface antigen
VKNVVLGLLAAAVLAAPAYSQSSSGASTDLPDRFQLDTGYFRLNADTTLRFDGGQGTGDVSFERDLGIPGTVDTFWVDGTWRLGRRHQLKLGFTRTSRDRNQYSLQREFTWGGETYQAGLSADSSTGADLLGGYYRFALVRSDRFEIGPSIGVGYLWLNASIQATGTVAGQSRSLDESASIGSITGAVGAYANAWLAKRLVVRGDFLYIKVTPGDSNASVTDWRVGADWYVLRNFGVGVQYKYNQYSYERGILVSKLGGEVTYKGVQVFASFLF